jgi:hypothetical protein
MGISRAIGLSREPTLCYLPNASRLSTIKVSPAPGEFRDIYDSFSCS